MERPISSEEFNKIKDDYVRIASKGESSCEGCYFYKRSSHDHKLGSCIVDVAVVDKCVDIIDDKEYIILLYLMLYKILYHLFFIINFLKFIRDFLT